jgi:hypothetical protein
VPKNFPSIINEDNSVSMFHPTETPAKASTKTPSVTFMLIIDTATDSFNGTLKYPRNKEDPETISKLSDTVSRISNLETNICELDNVFKKVYVEMKSQSHCQEEKQAKQGKVLEDTLQFMKISLPQARESSVLHTAPTSRSEEANDPQTESAGGSSWPLLTSLKIPPQMMAKSLGSVGVGLWVKK